MMMTMISMMNFSKIQIFKKKAMMMEILIHHDLHLTKKIKSNQKIKRMRVQVLDLEVKIKKVKIKIRRKMIIKNVNILQILLQALLLLVEVVVKKNMIIKKRKKDEDLYFNIFFVKLESSILYTIIFYIT